MTREEYNKHKELIEAWGNGAEIQYFLYNGIWADTKEPSWRNDVMYRIKPTKIEFEDCSFNKTEYYVNEWTEISLCNVENYHIDDRRGFFKDEKTAEAYAVLPQLIRLRDEYNEGWKPNWGDVEYKYSIGIYKNEWSLFENRYVQRILTFKTEKIRDKFFEDYEDLLEIAKPLL